MSSQSLTTLINAIEGRHEVAFMLVLARITPLFVLAPMFSSKLIPLRVKAMLAVALAIGLTPLAAHGQAVPGDPLAVVGLMLGGFVVGGMFALAIAAVFAAVQGAGFIADATSGFSYGSQIDPINGNQGGSLANFYNLVGLAVFLAIGGDAWMLRGLEATFRIVPLTHGPRLTTIGAGITQMMGTVFVGAIEVAAPIMLAMTIADIGFGMVAKVVPQLNVFAVGFPVKIGVALLAVIASLPFLGSWLTGQLDSSVGAALQTLRIA